MTSQEMVFSKGQGNEGGIALLEGPSAGGCGGQRGFRLSAQQCNQGAQGHPVLPRGPPLRDLSRGG